MITFGLFTLGLPGERPRGAPAVSPKLGLEWEL